MRCKSLGWWSGVVVAAGAVCGEPAGDDLRDALLADATGRTSLFRLGDGEPPVVKIGGVIQGRWSASLRDQDAAQSVDDFESGFEMRRVRLSLKGDLAPMVTDGGSRVPFGVQFEASRADGMLRLVDAWAGLERGPWRVVAGQFTPPWTRESIVSNTRRMAVEVSPATAAFTFAGASFRTQGAEVRYREGDWGVSAMLGDGDRGGNTAFDSDESDVSLVARVERKSGDGWKRFQDFTSRRGNELAWLAGAAGYASVGETDADGDGMQREAFTDFRGTADVSVEGDGWNVFVAGHVQQRWAQTADSINRWGASGHAGVYVSDDIEVFGQYSWIHGDSGEGDLSVLVAGFNRYISGHAAKLTVDSGVSFEPVTPAYSSGSRALLTDAPGQDGQVFVRAQMQLLF